MNPPSQPQTDQSPDSMHPLPPDGAQVETADYRLTATPSPLQQEGEPVAQRAMPESVGGQGAEVSSYDLLETLGRGGMGIVYKARHRQLKRLVALKMILAGAHASAEDLDRFRTEAESVARLQHPGIVQIYEIGEHQGLPFLALEFVAGGSLQAALTQMQWPARRAAELTLSLVHAIHYAHQHGVIHRDLKPANVLLTADGQPKVSDFGLAKQLDEAGRTHTGQILGTPRYMAPEQAGGKSKEVGPHTDVYALGAILYEFLTGRAPFRAVSVSETLELVRTQEPVPPSRLQPGTPRDLETICLKCLQKEPIRRYGSAAALADDLQRFLDGRPITARPIGTSERIWRWCRRNPRVAVPSALALLLLVSTAIISSTAYLVTSAALDAETKALHATDRALTEKKTALTEKTTALSLAELAKTLADKATEGQRQATLREAAMREEESRQRRLAVERLTRFTVANGARLLDDGDSSAALLYFIDALKNDPENEGLHRRRIARVLDAAARPVHMGFHDQAVARVAFDSSGSLLVSAGKDGSARIWELSSGAQLSLLRHKGEVRWAAFDAEGRRVVTGGSEGVVQVWDVRSGMPQGPPLVLRKAADHTAFSLDGRRVAAAGGDKYAMTEHRTGNITIPGPMRTQIIPQGPGRPPITILVPGPPTVIPQPTIHNPRGVVRVWNAADGADLCTVSILGWLNRVAFSPRDDLFATAGGRGDTGIQVRGEARVWRVAAGKAEAVTASLEHPTEVTSLVFSSDGARLLTACGQAVAGRGEARIWDVKTGQMIGRPMEHALQVIEAAFSPDGRLVVTASNDGTARVWDAETGEPVTPPLRHGDRLTTAAFSPDGRRVLTASRDGTARVWDAETGDPAGPPLHHGEPVTTAAFAPDGRRIATATVGGIVRVWDLAVAPPRLRLRHGTIVLGVGYSADGRHLVSAPGRRGSETLTGPGLAVARETHTVTHLCLWDGITGEAIGTPMPHSGRLSAGLLSPDGRFVMTAGAVGRAQQGNGVRRWHVANGIPEDGPFARRGVLAAGFASDSSPLVVTAARKVKDIEVQVWNIARGAALGPPLIHVAVVSIAALSKDGRTLATVAGDRLIRIWDVSSGRQLCPTLRPPQPVQHVEFSSDGSRLLTLASDLTLQGPDEGRALLWDLKESRAIPLPHGGRVVHVIFSPDGNRVATAGAEGSARIWAAVDGRPLTRPLRHAAALTHLAFSSDGLMLATAGHDRTARLWDARTGEPLSPPLPHGGTVMAAAFSPDGSQLATACIDGSVRTWDVARETRSPAQLVALAELLAGRRLDGTRGLTPMGPAALKSAWKGGRLPALGLTVPPERVLAWHIGEADEAERKKQWLGVVLHVGKQIDAEPKQPRPFARRARALAELGRWAEAAADFARAADLGDTEDATVRGLALCRLAIGQTDGYKAACAELLRRLGRSQLPAETYALARVLVAGPDALSDYTGLLEAIQKLEGKGSGRPGTWDVHSAALLRASKPAEAAERLTRAVKVNSIADAPWNWLLLALVKQQQREAGASTEWLQKAVACLEGAARAPGETRRLGALPWHRLSWEERLELGLLRKEAEKAAGGERRPKD